MDSSYESSTDPNKQYSALALINPSIDSTGDYKCVVQTRTETITVHKSVQVIDVRNYTLNMYRYQIQNETQLECTVSNVFPKPTITITYVAARQIAGKIFLKLSNYISLL